MESSQKFITLDNKEESVGQKFNKSRWYLYFCAFTANLLLLVYGCFVTWTSSSIPKLKSNNTDINPLGVPITTLQVSLIASLPSASSAISMLLMAKISDRLGRRKTMIYVAISLVCCLIVIAFAENIYLYYIFLFISGIGFSGAFVGVAVYVTEIADDQNRGKICCTLGLSVCVGLLIGYIFGSITSYKIFTLICALPALLHLILCIYTQESPIYIASQENKYETTRAIEKLWGKGKYSFLELEQDKLAAIVNAKSYQKNFLDIFKSTVGRRGFLMSVLPYVFQQFSGILIVLEFASPIFNEAGASISGDNVAILIGFATLATYIVAACFVDKLGRKLLLLTSSLLCATSMFPLGLYFYLQDHNVSLIENLHWLPVICILVYIFGYGIGLGPLPIAMVGEFFANDIRAIGTGTVFTVDAGIMTLISFCFPLVSEAFGRYACMWIFSASSMLGFLIMFFTLPETKGKTFLEIQEILIKHRFFKLKPDRVVVAKL